MTLDEFINRYTGQRITDNSGNYPGQCVSLVKRYAQEVLGVPNADSVLYVKEDKAKNLWYDPIPATTKYFDKVTKPQRGDIAVYDIGFYGDVAVVTGAQVFGQYGTPYFTPATKRSINEPNKPVGYLRKKGATPEGEEMLTNKDHLKALTRQFLGKDPTADTKKYLGKPYSYAVDKFTKARVDLPALLKENAKLKKLLAQAGDPTSNDQAVKDGLYDKIKKVFGK